MAMTPVVNETNRIQVGSPVPIGGSEQARAANEATDALGKAIFDLGNALDNEKEKEIDYRTLARIKGQEWEKTLIENKQKVRVTNPMLDKSGIEYSTTVFDSAEETRAQLRDTLPEPAKIYFDDYVGSAKVKHVGDFLETGIKANDELAKTMFSNYLTGLNDLAVQDPTTLPTRLMEVEVAIQESKQYRDSDKQAAITQAKAGMVKSVSDSFREQGRRLSDGKSFDQARIYLLQNSALLDKDALNKELKDINSEQYDAISRSRSDIDWNRKNNDYIETKDQSDMAAKITAKFRAAKTPYELLLVEKEATELVATKKMTYSQYQDAKGLRASVNKVVDDLFESRIINQLIQEQGALTVPGKKSAVVQINEAFKKPGGITAERHSDLIQLANRLRDSGSMSRERYTEMQSYMKVIDTYAQASITAIGDEQVKRQHAAAIAATQATFVKAVLSNDKATVSSIYESVVPKLDKDLSVQKIMSERIPNVPTINQVTPGAIQRSMPQLKQDVIDANKSGDAVRIKKANDALFKAFQRTKQDGK